MAQELVKQPGESKIFKFNFENILEDNEIITSIASTVQEDLGKVTGSTTLTLTETGFANTYTQVRISGGTNGENYKITMIVNTNAGNVLELEGILRIRNI